MKLRTIAVCSLIAAGSLLFGQQSPSPEQPELPKSSPASTTAIVAGRVTDRLTGQPLRKANVRLTPANGIPYTMTTDAAGQYRFAAVDPGNYMVQADRPGYLLASYGSRRSYSTMTRLKVTAGQELPHIDLPMTPTTVISGRVLDEDGDPVPDAYLSLLRTTYFGGRKQWQMFNTSFTSADGAFTFRNIMPGRFLIQARGSYFSAMRGTPIPPAKPGSTEGRQAQIDTFYPSESDPARASIIEVAAGREIRNLEIRLIKVPIYNVRGKVSGGAPDAQGWWVTLTRHSSLPGSFLEPVTVTADHKTGEFHLPVVAPGQYDLRAGTGGKISSPPLAHILLTVSDRDIDNLVVPLLPPIQIIGRLQFEGSEPPPAARRNLRVTLSPSGPGGSVIQAPVKADDLTFTFEGLGAMKYSLSTITAGSGYLKSARWGDQDITQTGLDLTSGRPSGELVITLSDVGGLIEGEVARPPDSSVAQALNCVAVLVPDSPQSPGTASGGYRAVTLAPDASHFQFKNVPPGQYRIFAFEDPDDNVWNDPEFLQPHERSAMTVVVTERSKLNISVPLVTAEAQARAATRR